MKLWSFHCECPATQQMRRDRGAHRVKNDDKITGETLSQSVPRKTVGKALQGIEISPKTKSISSFFMNYSG